ncbi:HAD family hydrolase [Pelagerythrobacter marensis]|uniref:Hydrolase, haloacid dehalogenase-like family protein n=1 Tax=Pelagerythrobacter marensis TaxID=543877 RepID=A0A0G3XBZ9_9SPHN|nr:HAD family phosphatase [Pelagerythrobacter marensis]AKM08712.1 Hydrolase, haloacid dehalogenase-like family protein [Pelagerythrobacter marensis]
MSETDISRESPAVEAVVFDVGRVIVQWDLRALFAKLIDDPAELDRFLAEVVTEEWHFQHDAGRPLAETVPERQAEFPQYAALIAAYAERFLDSIPGRVPGTAQLVQRLAGREVPLYAITNFGAEFWDMFRPTEPLFDLFGDIVVSGREKMMKPHPPIFALAAERFGHEPGAMLFIDDNRANIDAAAALGWQVHHFRDAARLERDLQERGLI